MQNLKSKINNIKEQKQKVVDGKMLDTKHKAKILKNLERKPAEKLEEKKEETKIDKKEDLQRSQV